MHVTVTSAKTADQPPEYATILGEEMVRWLRDIDGFEGFLMLSQEGRTLGLSFWESREAAERHRVARARFRERMLSLADVEAEESTDYEVTFALFGPRLAEPSSG